MTILARGFGDYARQHAFNQDEKDEFNRETERLKKHLPKEFHPERSLFQGPLPMEGSGVPAKFPLYWINHHSECNV